MSVYVCVCVCPVPGVWTPTTSALKFFRAAELVLEARSSPFHLLCCPRKAVASQEWPSSVLQAKADHGVESHTHIQLSHNIAHAPTQKYTHKHTQGRHRHTHTSHKRCPGKKSPVRCLMCCSKSPDRVNTIRTPKTTIPAQLHHISSWMTLGKSLPLPGSQAHLQAMREVG